MSGLERRSLGVDDLLEGVHLLHQFVRIGLRHLRRDGVVAIEDPLLLALRDDVAPNVESVVEVGLLSEVTHLGAISRPRLARELPVDPRNDLQERRLARAVDAHHADLGVGVEAQPDVLEQLLAAGPGFGQALHLKNVLLRHRGRPRLPRVWERARR
jgi:hypothetical protein